MIFRFFFSLPSAPPKKGVIGSRGVLEETGEDPRPFATERRRWDAQGSAPSANHEKKYQRRRTTMLRSLMSGVTGVKAHQTLLDVTGNNIANVNTAGFKKDRKSTRLTPVT